MANVNRLTPFFERARPGMECPGVAGKMAWVQGHLRPVLVHLSMQRGLLPFNPAIEAAQDEMDGSACQYQQCPWTPLSLDEAFDSAWAGKAVRLSRLPMKSVQPQPTAVQ